MMLRGRLTPLTSSLITSCSVALSGAEYVMSRSMHSSTEYFGSPSEYFTNSNEKFSWTSVIGKRSLKTRSSPISSRSCEAASSCSSASNARVWISRRCGICIPPASLANEICLIVSAISHLTERGHAPRAPRLLILRLVRGQPAHLIWNRTAESPKRSSEDNHVSSDDDPSPEHPLLSPFWSSPASGAVRARHASPAFRPRAMLAQAALHSTPTAPRTLRARKTGPPQLLHLDRGPLLLELGLDRVGLILRNTGLDRLWCAVHQILRLLESEAR